LRFIPDEKFEGLLYNLYNHSKRVLIGYSGDRKKQLIERMVVYGFIQSEDEMTLLRKQLEPWKTKPAIKALYHGGLYFLCGE
jgi:hypothetical protein